MDATKYLAQYGAASDRIDAIVQALAQQPGRAFELAMQAGGEQAVQAMLDAVLDQGHRKVLVDAMKSPALTDEMRTLLEDFLYGSLRPLAALLVNKLT